MYQSPLPEMYTRWMEDLLGAPLPVEKRATCNDCKMAPPHSGTCGNDIVFYPNKCCTFWPDLPNYLAGAVLSDESTGAAAGRAQFERNAEARAVINPLGIFPTAEYSAAYRYSYNNFTQRESLLCPYYMKEQGGICGIWRYRNGRCSTWFCKHERGSISQHFWQCLDRLLAALEFSLASWCLEQLHIDPIADSKSRMSSAAATWKEWSAHERDFYHQCWLLVQPLEWDQVLQIAGVAGHTLARETAAAFRQWQSPRVPERLLCGKWNVEPINAVYSRVWAYSIFDPMDIETTILEALSLFDGSPVAQVLERIHSEKGIHLSPEFLQQLCDTRILIPAE